MTGRKKHFTYGKAANGRANASSSQGQRFGTPPQEQSGKTLVSSALLRSPSENPLTVTAVSSGSHNTMDEFDIVSSEDELAAPKRAASSNRRPVTATGESLAALSPQRRGPIGSTSTPPAKRRRKLSKSDSDKIMLIRDITEANHLKQLNKKANHLLDPAIPKVQNSEQDGLSQSVNTAQQQRTASKVPTEAESATETILAEEQRLSLRNETGNKAHLANINQYQGYNLKTETTAVTKKPSTPPRMQTPDPQLEDSMQISSTTSTPRSAKAVTTPRQTKLWSTLLNRANKDAPSDSKGSNLFLAQGGLSPRRKRLVDKLKAARIDTSPLPTESPVPMLQGAPVKMEDQLRDDREPNLSQISQSQAKVTYAGERSYLQDSGQDSDQILLEPLDDLLDASPTGTSGAFQAKQDVFDVSEDEHDTGAVRSIHELRAAGRLGSFTNDVQALLEDLRTTDMGATSRKVSAMTELCQKLMETTFRLPFTQGAYETQVLNEIVDIDNPLIQGLFAGSVVLLLEDDRHSNVTDHLVAAKAVPFLTRALQHPASLPSFAKEQRMSLSRLAQSKLHNLHGRMVQTTMWRTNGFKSLSPMVLALYALELIVRNLRQSGNTSIPFLDHAMLSRLLQIFETNSKLDNGIGHFTTKSVLSIIESSNLSAACVADRTLWTRGNLGKIAAAASAVLSSASDNSSSMLALRLLISLANHNTSNSEGLSKGELISHLLKHVGSRFDKLQASIVDYPMLDLLVLGLGALINLAECSITAREHVSNNDARLLDELVGSFIANCESAAEADSLQASQLNVAFGYLAVMLGHLCQDDSLRSRIAAQLPGSGLHLIIEAIEEFIKHHQAADETSQSNEAYTTFTERLCQISDQLRRLDGE